MKTSFLGLELRSPIVVGSSPYTASLANIERCVEAGAGAVVLKSIFEEQILHQAASFDTTPQTGMGDAGEYLERFLGEAYKEDFLRLTAGARALDIPVIASINCFSASPAWIDYASALEQAGASALELNIFLLPADRTVPSPVVEQAYADIVRRVAAAVRIPVSVKLPMRLTNLLAMGDALLARGARGLVLFNRFFEPDIDVERLEFVAGNPFSSPDELRNVLRSAVQCATFLPQLDLAVSTGVHDGPAAVKALLCGARAVQICTAIHRYGYEVIGRLDAFVDEWAARHGFRTLDEFRGRLNFGRRSDDLSQRVQYMNYFPHLAE